MSLSREEAANALVDLYGYFRKYYNPSDTMSEAISMATASLRNEGPKERIAKWVYDHWCEFKCSNCGAYSISTPKGKEPYCYNCGAKMKVAGANDKE